MLRKANKRRYLHFLFVLILSLPVAGFAQTKTFIQKFRPLADSLSLEYGIPSAIILGVAIIESASGTSKNCRQLNNYFGIEGGNELKKVGRKSRYKQYPDATASFVHFCKLVRSKKYYKKLYGNEHYKLWTAAMSKHGYSEVPAVWQQRVNDVIRKNRLSFTP
jgi:flagellum-specific peptidoglycan hydrolase FlgJ